MNAAIADAKDITVDLTDLEYLASAGLRAFVSAQKQMDAIDKKLALAHVQEDVMEVFTITGLDDVFTFE
jgi:anti-anti-sigma factor